jgi:thioredoxin 1
VTVTVAPSDSQCEEKGQHDLQVAERRYEGETAQGACNQEQDQRRCAASSSAGQGAAAKLPDRESAAGGSSCTGRGCHGIQENKSQPVAAARCRQRGQQQSSPSGRNQASDGAAERNPETERDSEPVPEAHGPQCRRKDTAQTSGAGRTSLPVSRFALCADGEMCTSTNQEIALEENGESLLLFFFSVSSGPARRMDSLVAHIARKERKTLRVVRVDVNERPDLADRFKVNAAPALVLVENGRVTERIEGRASASRIERMLEPHLADRATLEATS